jgi:hypothetical protein
MPMTHPGALEKRERLEVTQTFTAYSREDGRPQEIPADHAVFAILAPVAGKSDEIEFTWGSVGEIWYRAPRSLFLQSARQLAGQSG